MRTNKDGVIYETRNLDPSLIDDSPNTETAGIVSNKTPSKAKLRKILVDR